MSSQPASDDAIVITADSTAGRATWFYNEDVAGRLADPDFDAVVDKVADGYVVHVKAHTLLRDVALMADRAAPDAVADDALITLCRGETATITCVRVPTCASSSSRHRSSSAPPTNWWPRPVRPANPPLEATT